MVSEWRSARLGDIASELTGRISSNHSGLKVFGVQKGVGLTAETRYASADVSKYKLIEPGDFAYNPMRLNIGSIGMCRHELGPGLVSPDYVAFRLNDSVDPNFLAYYTETQAWREWVERAGGGSVRIRIYFANLAEMVVRFPDLKSQKSAVAVLRSIDDRIENLRQINVTLDAMAQAVFKSWFVDFDPVRAKSEGREPRNMDAATAALFPAEFENSQLGLIPKGWRARPFGMLLRHSIGGDWGSETPEGDNNERISIIRGTDIPDLRSQSAFRVPDRFTSTRKVSGRALSAGDLVVEVSGGSKEQPTGRSLYVTPQLLGLFDCPVVPASFCRKFSPVSPHLGLLLAQHMDFIYAAGRTWGYQNQSTGIANFQTKRFLANELVVVPSDDVLEEFKKVVGVMVERTQVSQARRLAELRDAVLPRLISGKLRVAHAHREIEEALV